MESWERLGCESPADAASMVQEAARGRLLPPVCLKLAMDATQLLLMWSLRGLEQDPAPASSAVASLAKAVTSFGRQLDAIGAAEDDAEVQQALQKAQSNLFLVFSDRTLRVCAHATCLTGFCPRSMMCCQCEADARFWFLSAEAIAISRPLTIPKEPFQYNASSASHSGVKAYTAIMLPCIAGLLSGAASLHP